MADQVSNTTTTATSSATKEITQYLNVNNAKLVALAMVFAFILYHSTLHFKYGNDSCKWLMSEGRFPGSDSWQPYGCMMHKYSKADARTCMHYVSYWGGHNHIAFIGDSRIRQLYHEMVDLISEGGEEITDTKVHHDMHYRDNKINIKIDFLWHPMVNASMYDVYHKWLKSDQPGARPNVVITGSATWAIKLFNGSTLASKNFQSNLTMIKEMYNKLQDSTKVVWMLQDPAEEDKLSENRKMITNEQIDKYNKIAITVLQDSSAHLWSSSRLVAQGLKKEEFSTDGLHLRKKALEIDTQMLINMYCNNDMNHNDGTCCNTPERATTLQIITGVAFIVCMCISGGLMLYRRRVPRNGNKARTAENGQRNGTNGTQKDYNETFWEIITSLAKMGLIMAYFYLCDRTNFFMKENKYYTTLNFCLPFAYIMILGFFFTENTDKVTVLHRDQTDEWKGWMQLVILIYHLTGASKVLPLYMHIRVLVSSYLFLTGFGHFCYYWDKGEFGFVRYCLVLFRINFLVVTLCFVMNRPYQFYYFVPLVSFWFLVIYLVMAIPPHVTSESSEANPIQYLYMILKFVALIVVICLFYLSEVFFEKVFLTRPIKALFVTSDDSIHEWRFRWQLDRFSPVYGMLFAFGYKVLVRYRIVKDDSPNNLFSNPISWSLCGLSIIGIASYAVFSVLCSSKIQCNEVHSYLVFLPIISFILLRNVLGCLRTRYSSFFAWFGKISLELFICQYHIWMAADTHGTLVLIPSYPVLNVVITSFIFIVISHEISVITQSLCTYAVPQELKALLRNIIGFIAVLLPLCYFNGLLL
ncbi:N-acetylneuraminate 9-O-acetyltransferase-like isoform X2 [Physella acuta]|uniref:N-acetylneuraminate 9-O-acetyltransferase-like isoform X2 n=1 Tax=Physella acuta TaxID=109671 RepID=UPI0027DC7859|nr:N-acetylneuraminate 9-O-acetyltransferase-like isoform X2 [Physella acuta]